VFVHDALHKIIPLHPVLVAGSIREVKEISLAKCDVFELPIVCKAQADVIANRPVIGLAFDETSTRTPLRMAGNAGVIRCDRIHFVLVQNISAGRMRNVLTPGPVATLTAHVPFCNLLCMNVIADRMATVAGWSSWALHVVGWIVFGPPVCAGIGNVILKPFFVADIPLHRKGIVIVAYLGEIALFPFAAVYEAT